MTRKLRIRLAGIVGSAILLLSIFLVGGYLYQRSRDREFVKARLMPLVGYVESFRAKEGRLPSTDEFSRWADIACENKAVCYFPQKPAFLSEWGIGEKDFVVGAWRGEWYHFYSSWDQDDFSDPSD